MKAKKYVLVLRTCKADMTSQNGFVWPKKGKVQCDDWVDNKQCGNGLHGLLWGEGDGSLLNFSEYACWIVCKVEESLIVDLVGKVKFPSATVVHCGDRLSATEYIKAHGGAGRLIVGSTNTGGDGSTNKGGEESVLIFYFDDGNRKRVVVGYVGEDGIKPNVPYKLNSLGKIVEAT